ncbi:hypothetical protein KFK09_026794 [Dendrobium nobile]|uniref:Uncharacterized protein n=1 Tax=Dendrobium nobile TaxID=94219 RepID=A0A8T3A9A1_DENNO|nr:hypothetical protein KFK09_026794 [Dendrobium nobile]
MRRGKDGGLELNGLEGEGDGFEVGGGGYADGDAEAEDEEESEELGEKGDGVEEEFGGLKEVELVVLII